MLGAAVSNIDNNDSSTDIAKSITVHDAVTWTAYAARKVTNQTVTNCFYHAGFPRPADTDTDLPATTSDQSATELQLASLVTRASSYLKLKDPLSAADYLASDELAPTTEELAEDWEDQKNYTTSASTDEQSEEDEPEPEPEAEPEPLLIHSMSEALKWTRQLKMFYMEKNLPDIVEGSGSMEDKTTRHMITVQCQRKQVTQEDFTQLFATK